MAKTTMQKNRMNKIQKKCEQKRLPCQIHIRKCHGILSKFPCFLYAKIAMYAKNTTKNNEINLQRQMHIKKLAWCCN